MSKLDRELRKVARRASRDPASADDLVQQAWLAAVERHAELGNDGPPRGWLAGAIRKLGALEARAAARRRRRETSWASAVDGSSARGAPWLPEAFLARLPRAVRSVAELAAADLGAAEIRWILALSDTAFRQRLVRLRRDWLAWAEVQPLEGPRPCQALGPRRPALVALARERKQIAFLATDPDGHVLLFCRRSLTKPEPPAT